MRPRRHLVEAGWRVAVGVPALVFGAAGCFQEIDSRASSETASSIATPTNGHTVDLSTPPIGITPGDEGETTDDACEATTFSAMEVLRRNCAACHGGGPGQNLGQPPFDFVLDTARLITAGSSTVKDPATMQPARFLVPGDPDHSRVYIRMFRREMPPADVVGLPQNPSRPTVSDVSVVRHWIAHCLGGKEGGGDSGNGPQTPDAGTGAADGDAPDEPKEPPPTTADGASDARTDAGDGATTTEAGPREAAAPTDGGADAADGRRRFDGRPGGGDGGGGA